MSPIEVKPRHAETTRIAKLIASVGASSAASPFAMCPMLHMARFVVLDDVRPRLGSTPSSSLRTNYLLFVAAIDGQLDDFLDCLYAVDPKFVHGVWGRCLGYPEDARGDSRRGPVFLRRYVKRSLLPVQLPFVAFPGHSALDIRGAVSLHANMLEWMATIHCSQLDDAELMRRWNNQVQEFFAGAVASR
jgi:hypothetical protein